MSRRKSSQTKISLFSFQDIITSVTGIMILTTLLLALELLSRTEGSPPVQTAEHTETALQTSEELRAEIDALRTQLKASQDNIQGLPSLNADSLKEMSRSASEESRRLENELSSLQHKLDERLVEAKNVGAEAQDKIQHGQHDLQQLQKQIADSEQRIASLEGSNRVFYSSGIQGKKMWVVEITSQGLDVAEMGVQSVPMHFSSTSALKRWLSTLTLSDNALFLLIKPGGAVTFREIQSYLSGRMDFGFQVIAADQEVLDPKFGAGKP